MIDNRENNVWTVYVHIVPQSITEYDYDKYYVGITSKSVEKRWGKNGNSYHGQPFYNTIQKYGWNNIKHYIIAEYLTENEAKDFEKTLIDKLKCNLYKDKYGYNMTDGGDGTLGYNMSQEEKEKRRKRYLGKGNPYYGKKHTEETKQKISKHHADVSGINNPFRKEVYQFTIDGEYINKYCSCNEAGRVVGLKNGHSISNAALKHRMSADYLWEYEDNVIQENGIYKIKKYKYNKYQNWTNKEKRVFAFNKYTKELIYDFKSCVIASQVTHIYHGTISVSARKKSIITKSDYIWRYEENVGFNKDGKAYFIE